MGLYSWEIPVAVLIYLVVPLAGLIVWLLLVWRMYRKTDLVPLIPSFLVFAIYGGVLLMVLTSLFWYWSRIASMGAFFLILVAPFVMGFLALSMRTKRNYSRYHKIFFYAAAGYFLVFFPLMIYMLIMGPRQELIDWLLQ